MTDKPWFETPEAAEAWKRAKQDQYEFGFQRPYPDRRRKDDDETAALGLCMNYGCTKYALALLKEWRATRNPYFIDEAASWAISELGLDMLPDPLARACATVARDRLDTEAANSQTPKGRGEPKLTPLAVHEWLRDRAIFHIIGVLMASDCTVSEASYGTAIWLERRGEYPAFKLRKPPKERTERPPGAAAIYKNWRGAPGRDKRLEAEALGRWFISRLEPSGLDELEALIAEAKAKEAASGPLHS